jgi:predicted DsbA family dithiol-disulfide isomerase
MNELTKLTRNLLNEKDLGQGVKIRIYESKSKDRIFGEISACVGKLTIEKTYQNNYNGHKELEAFLSQFKTSEDVFKYFKLDKEEINMNLETLVKEIEKNKKYANEVIEGGNPATLNTRLGRKKAAKSRLEELYTEYRLSVKDHLVFIVPVGKDAEEITKLAEEGGTSIANADSFYEDLANRIPPILYNGKQTQASLIDVFSRHLEDKAMEIGVRSYPMVIYNRKYARKVQGKEDLVSLIKKIINEDVGSEMVAAQILDEVAKSAMKDSFSKGKLPVVVSVKDQSIVEHIVNGLKTISPNVFMVGSGKTGRGKKSDGGVIGLKSIDAKGLEEAFAKIKKQVR